MGTLGEIVNRVNTTESATLEFKSAKGGFPGSFWETYSSFANTQGGIIYLGVKEKNHEFYIDGLSAKQIRSYEKELWDNLNNRGKVSVNILSNSDVQVIETESGYVLEVSIPRAQLSQRPVFLNKTPAFFIILHLKMILTSHHSMNIEHCFPQCILHTRGRH